MSSFADNSENFYRISTKVRSNSFRVSDVCLEMSSDAKNYFGFLVDEITELQYTIKSLCSRHLKKNLAQPGLSPEERNIEAENLTQANEWMNLFI